MLAKKELTDENIVFGLGKAEVLKVRVKSGRAVW